MGPLHVGTNKPTVGNNPRKILQAPQHEENRNTWARELITEIWRLHWTIWNQRNETLHATGNHNVLGTKEYEKEIKKVIQEGYAFLLPNEKYLLKGITMGTVRKWSANKKEKWLRTVRAARHTSCIRHQQTRQSRQNMHNWLRTST
jgi:hypothetical protein